MASFKHKHSNSGREGGREGGAGRWVVVGGAIEVRSSKFERTQTDKLSEWRELVVSKEKNRNLQMNADTTMETAPT